MRENYERRKGEFLDTEGLCEANKELYSKFFAWEENKLLKINDIQELDDACYRTLKSYLQKLKNVNVWFKNEPLKNITKEDFEQVYNGIETGSIKNKKGMPFKDKKGYYSKIFCSKLFRMIGKSEMAKEIIDEFGTTKKKKQKPKYIREEDFRKVVDACNLQKHKLLTWLCFDFGENIFTMLQLKKSDFERNIREGRVEYKLYFREEILKRSRDKVCDVNNYDETAKFLDGHLTDLQEDENLFDFSYHSAVKFLKRAIRISKVRCRPRPTDSITWKVLRNSMMCDLASKGWDSFQIKKRAGHKPSSTVIDIYLNLEAVEDGNSKSKVDVSQIDHLRHELTETKHREKIIQVQLRTVARRLERIETLLFENKQFQAKATTVYLEVQQ